MATLYVGNIPYDSTEDEIRDVFSTAGQVNSVRIITDRETGKSKGFCFVDMSDITEALKMSNAELRGRTLRVNEARQKESHGNASFQAQSRDRYR